MAFGHSQCYLPCHHWSLDTSLDANEAASTHHWDNSPKSPNPDSSFGGIRVLQRNSTNRMLDVMCACARVDQETYCKEPAHMMMGMEKCQDLQLAQ